MSWNQLVAQWYWLCVLCAFFRLHTFSFLMAKGTLYLNDNFISFYYSIYQCQFHGDFRVYQDTLLRYKSWCILWVTIFLIPFGLVVKASGIDLNWVMLFGFIVTIPCFPAVALAIFSSKTTGPGVICGIFHNLVC